MSTDEINRAIAEHVGARFFTEDGGGFWNFVTSDGRQFGPPTEDLNAMHEAEKVLTPLEFEVYRWILWGLCKQPQVTEWSRSYLSAVASQRAEAFLKAIGKWRDS